MVAEQAIVQELRRILEDLRQRVTTMERAYAQRLQEIEQELLAIGMKVEVQLKETQRSIEDRLIEITDEAQKSS